MKPLLPIENLEILIKLQETYEDYNVSLSLMAKCLKEKLELLDSENGDGISLYSTLIHNLKSLDGTYIQSRLRDTSKLRHIWTKLVAANEIQLNENQIIIVRWQGNPSIDSKPLKTSNPLDMNSDKHPTGRPRRISFASIKVYDGDKILTTEELAAMTDLKFLFSLNGYHLPGCDSTKERGIYEHFFDRFLKLVLEDSRSLKGNKSMHGSNFQYDSLEEYVYLVLQETIFMLHTIVELFVNVIELLLEMINFIQLRVKTASSVTSLKVILHDSADPVLTFVMTNFTDPERAFVDFASQKLIKGLSKQSAPLPADKPSGNGSRKGSDDRIDSEWTARILEYSAVLEDAIDIYEENCQQCLTSLSSLKDRGAVSLFKSDTTSSKLEATKGFCNNIIVFIGEFQSLLKQLKTGPVYREFLDGSLTLLRMFDGLETSHPTKYGSLRKSMNSSSRSSPSTPRSTESSPRPVPSPDNPNVSTLSKIMSILSPRTSRSK
jgi:hypothetical protein